MKTGKKVFIGIVLVALAALIVVAVNWGKQYYRDRYVGSDYYAMVPLNYGDEPETLYSDNGEDIGLGKVYHLTAYNASGEARQLTLTVHSIGSGFVGERELLKPGAYLLIEASSQIVTSFREIEKSQVPSDLIDKVERGG